MAIPERSAPLDRRIMDLMEQDISGLVSQWCNLSLALAGSSAKGAPDLALQMVQRVESLLTDIRTLGLSAQELLDASRAPVLEPSASRMVGLADETMENPFDDGQRG